MTWRHCAAIALLALAACSTTDASAGGDPYENGSGMSGAEAGDGDPSGDGDGDQTDTTGGGSMFDLGGQPTAACDPWAQDCPPGEKCSWEQVANTAQTRCVPVEPDAKLPGEPCSVFGDPSSGYDDCVLGALCTYLDEQNQGVCVALCSGSPGDPICEQAQATCQVCPDCPSLCIPLCDPLAQDCAPGFTCLPDSGSFACHPDGQSGSGSLGDACEYAIQCGAGHACIDADMLPGCPGAGCCAPFCSVAAPDCPSGLICVPWFDGDNPLPDLGVCQAA